MGVVVVCIALVLLGLVAVVRWGGLAVESPVASTADSGSRRPSDVARGYVWSVAVATAAGIGSGLLVSGPGGRLAMRLLAATAGSGAQGRITEADEIVGRITVGGTIGFILFVGLGSGILTGALYMMVRRWLPAGRLGGLIFGALILLVLAPAIDPLRRANTDFDLVGPGWLAVGVFVVLGLTHGMAVAALAGRYGRTLPAFQADRRVLVRYWPLLPLFPLGTPVLAVALVGAILVGLSRVADVGAILRHHGSLVAGRIVLAVGAVVALPSFVGTVVDIAGRGP
jgi:hypothetical protein